MSVTYPRGFRASGTTAGLKPSGKTDLAVVVNDGPADAVAAVYTANRCKANPVLWSQQASADGTARAVVLNSGGANCYTGDYGYETTELTATRTAELLGTDASDVLVCSTGLIGVGGPEFREPILDTLPAALEAAAETPEAGAAAAEAIMTTDTVAKTATREGTAYRIGGMAKGAGMLAPGLATMLVVITTDAVVESGDLDIALRAATQKTFDRLDTDGCMSTNDTVIVMSSGASEHQADLVEFTRLLTEVCGELTAQLHKDAEGAGHDITITTRGAFSEQQAVDVSRAVARSNLFKAAVFGEDPNWGRVVAQIGTTDAEFDPQAIDVTFNGVPVCVGSAPAADPAEVLFDRRVVVEIDLHAGNFEASVWTSDLTHDYVEENSAYSS